MIEEFQDLKQANMSVAQYVNKFNELAQYVDYLISTTDKKNQ